MLHIGDDIRQDLVHCLSQHDTRLPDRAVPCVQNKTVLDLTVPDTLIML